MLQDSSEDQASINSPAFEHMDQQSAGDITSLNVSYRGWEVGEGRGGEPASVKPSVIGFHPVWQVFNLFLKSAADVQRPDPARPSTLNLTARRHKMT